MKILFLSIVFAFFASTAPGYSQTAVRDLRVEYLKNPVGLDVEQPRFSWKMESPQRNVSQTAYEITVSTDATGQNPVWTSGQIASGQSVHIPYGGSALSPATRYYWKVNVWDNQNRTTSSTESAFFETGLMNAGWSGAKWLKIKDETQDETNNRDLITNYSLEMDFEIADLAAGPVFGAKDRGNNFFMWQINIDNSPGRTLLRPHSWQNGNPACHADIDITGLVSIQKGQTHHLRIAIDGDKASTYIDNILVDGNRSNPRGGNYGYGAVGIGFRADRNEQYVAEKAYYDNVAVQAEIEGQEENLLTETFSDPENHSFTFGTVENGRLYVSGVTSNEPHHLSWQQEPSGAGSHFTLEADLTLISDNAGIIFSAKNTNNFYMWSINTCDNATQPILRRHFNNGSWIVSDALIGEYFSKADLLNHERHLKIEVKGNLIQTFIDGVLVDTYTDVNGQPVPRGVGFRAFKSSEVNEIAEWDNVVLTDYSEGDPVVVFSENFDSGNNPFDKGEILLVDGNGKFRLSSDNDETRTFDDSLYGIPLFRTGFELDREIRSARVYASGLGVYDLFINGQRVGTPVGDKIIYDEFKPGWTDYRKTVFYTTHDVTDHLQQGPNAIGASVSSGWWNGAIAHGQYGNPALGFLARLVVEYTDGSSKTIVTDPANWVSSTNGPVRTGDIYHGESYDARKESTWSSPGFDDSGWLPCALNTDFNGDIKAFVGMPVQVRPELQRIPVKITKYEGVTATGTTYGAINAVETRETPSAIQLNRGQTAVYDLGQNMAGWVKFKVKGAAGSRLTIRFAEMLNDDGSASRGNDGPGGSLYRVALRSAKATLTYTLKGDAGGEEFHPSTSFFGFRYCDVTTTHPVEIESLTGEVVGTVTEEGSSFSTSHPDVNQLYSNIRWGQRSNFLSIPTDCPQRDERLGWTGDIQVFGRAATYNADVAAFFRKWMGDLRDGQRADGAYPVTAPVNWAPEHGSAAWADAGVVIPWITYLMYDDKGILEENFESMEKYMDFLTTPLGGSDRSGYGDWLAFVSTDHRYINVCYYAYVALLMEKISKALSTADNDSYSQKAASYRTLYQNIKGEFQTKYVNDRTSLLTEDTQTAYLLALRFDLLNDRQKGIDRLKQLIVNNGDKLNTGFVGTGILNQTLSETGLTDIAYNLLLQRNNPSWLYSIDQGATTIWERWNSYTKEAGFGDIGMNSFNHYAYGAVGEWMYRYMGGIDVDENNPGFKHILLNPSPDFRETRPAGQARITRATAGYNSYYGNIRSAWEIVDGNNAKYDVVIPANTTATLTLILGNDRDEILESGQPAQDAEGVISVQRADKKAVIELQSGSYSFEVRRGTAINAPSAKRSDLYVYPNPVDNILNIGNGEDITNVRLFNSLGKLVYTQPGGAPLDMAVMPSGIYFVQVSGRDNLAIAKVIKE